MPARLRHCSNCGTSSLFLSFLTPCLHQRAKCPPGWSNSLISSRAVSQIPCGQSTLRFSQPPLSQVGERCPDHGQCGRAGAIRTDSSFATHTCRLCKGKVFRTCTDSGAWCSSLRCLCSHTLITHFGFFSGWVGAAHSANKACRLTS